MQRAGEYITNLSGEAEYKSFRPTQLPVEINMDAENRKEIPLYILKNYDLVNLVANEEITPEQEEKPKEDEQLPEEDNNTGENSGGENGDVGADQGETTIPEPEENTQLPETNTL